METTDTKNAIKKASEQYMRDFKRNITETISQIKATIEQSQNGTNKCQRRRDDS